MSFCDKDRLSRFAAGIKERYMRKADYDSDQSIIKAGGIETFFEPDFEKIFNITSILSRISLFVHQKVRKIFFERQILISH